MVQCSACCRPITDRYTKAGGETFHLQCFVCKSCKQAITGSYSKDEAGFTCAHCHEANAPRCKTCHKPVVNRCTTVDGQAYHPECFACGRCKEAISGGYFRDDRGMHICPACHRAQAPVCVGCQLPILEDGIMADERHYHRKCFKCNACARLLTGAFHPENGKVLCEPCHEVAHPPKRCNACACPIRGGGVEVEGKCFHSGCLRCYSCKGRLEGKFMKSQDGKGFLCDGCQPRCAFCKEPLAGRESLTVDGHRIHSSCFRCLDCTRCIDQRYFQVGSGKYRCLDCHMCHLKKDAEVELTRVESKEAHLKADNSRRHRLFWRPEIVPGPSRALRSLGVSSSQILRSPSVCVIYNKTHGSVCCAATPKREQAAAVNIWYLICSLKVLREHRREPVFSLDPKDPHDISGETQVKRFEPAWLAGSVVGEVLFQADYALKELCLGERTLPSLPDVFGGLDNTTEGGERAGRQWFVIQGATVTVTDDGVLVPHVKMGVEARRLTPCAEGYRDAEHTDANDPFVQQARAITQHFKDVASQMKAVGELVALAKSMVVARYLLSKGCQCDGSMLDKCVLPMVPEEREYGLEIPTLARRRRSSSVGQDPATGQVMVSHEHQAIHGGVDLHVPALQAPAPQMKPVRLLEPAAPRELLPLFLPLKRAARAA